MYMNDFKKGFVVGMTTLTEVFIVNDEKPYTQSEYLIIKNKEENVSCEVIETFIVPFANDNLLPKGCTCECIKNINLNLNSTLYFAKVKILTERETPIIPESEVISAKYTDIANIIKNAEDDDSIHIGIIKGTEIAQDELPQELKNVSPLWEKGKAKTQKGVPLLLNYHSFREYPHIGLFGSSGSGKSFALRVLCEELMRLNIPALAFDPHNELKFEGIMEGLDDNFDFNFKSKYEEFVIGENVGIKFEDLNTQELISLYSFVDPLTEPQKNAVEVLYEKGDTFKTFQNKISTLKSGLDKSESKKKETFTPLEEEMLNKYSKKVSGSASLQALLWKCISLEKTNIFNGNVFEVKNCISKRKIAIIRGDICRLQMISSYLIKKLYKMRRKYVDNNDDFFPPFFTIFDEAHNFAPEGGKNNPIKLLVREIGQEARKYGVFLMLCTQRPNNLDSTLLAQLNTKFFFRLTDSTDIEVAKVSGNLTDLDIKRLPDLSSGTCFLNSAILGKTYPIRFRTTFSKAPNVKDPFEELNTKINFKTPNELERILIKYLPITTIKLGRELINIKKEYGKDISLKEVMDCLDDMVSKNILIKDTSNPIGIKYIKV